MTLLAIFAPVVSPYDPRKMQLGQLFPSETCGEA
jgi:hypothetical protein